jgi:hypothetical protein
MEREPGARADRPPQYSLRQLWIAVLICSLAIHVGLTVSVLLALIVVQVICFLLIESLRVSGKPANRHVTVGENSRIAPFEQNE